MDARTRLRLDVERHQELLQLPGGGSGTQSRGQGAGRRFWRHQRLHEREVPRQVVILASAEEVGQVNLVQVGLAKRHRFRGGHRQGEQERTEPGIKFIK